MSDKTCEKIIDDIKNLSKGTIFTIKEFLDKYNLDRTLYLEYSVNIADKIREFAKIHEDEKGSFRGLPFVFRYIKK